MIDDTLSFVFLTLWIVVVSIFGYSAYWAFIIRGALQQALYKKQALWVGGMAIYFVSLSSFLTLALTFNVNELSSNILGGALISSGFIIIFLWIDYTVRVARRSDPLGRDAIRWSKLRYLWGFFTVGGAIAALFDAITQGISSAAPFGGILFIGAIAIIISARRSSDPTLRRHLKWTGLCIFMLWLGSQVEQPLLRVLGDSALVESITFSFVAIGAYGLYRSAKSLVPMDRLSKIDTSSPNLSMQPASFSGATVSRHRKLRSVE